MIHKNYFLVMLMSLFLISGTFTIAQNAVSVNSCAWINGQNIDGQNGLPLPVYTFQNPPDGYFSIYSDASQQIKLMEGEIAASMKQGVWIYYLDGIIIEKIEYLDDIQNGSYEAYYPNGQIRVACQFVNGLAQGLFTVYDPQGNISMQKSMSNGLAIQD